DRARDQFLAGARLAAQEHGDVGAGDAADRLVDVLHPRVPADERAELAHFREPRAEPRDLLGEPTGGQRALAEQQHLVEVERLVEIVIGAALHGLDGGGHGAVGGHDHDVHVGTDLADTLERGEPVESRHADVEEHEVEGLCLEDPHRLLAVLHRRHVVADPAQAFLEDPAQAVFVVGDQDTSGHQARAMGRKQVTAVPRPSALSTWIAPWCSSTMRWQRARPRPRPRSLVVKNGSKILARTSAGMPVPSSATWASTIERWTAPTSI